MGYYQFLGVKISGQFKDGKRDYANRDYVLQKLKTIAVKYGMQIEEFDE